MNMKHNGGYLILLGIASLFDGLVRVLTLGIICPSTSLRLQIWKVQPILQKISESRITKVKEE